MFYQLWIVLVFVICSLQSLFKQYLLQVTKTQMVQIHRVILTDILI